MQGGGSQDDLLQGVSPSSTIRDLEAACGPLSAASGLLETASLPPAKDAAILPLLWARLVSSLLQLRELQPLLCMPLPYIACIHSLLCTRLHCCERWFEVHAEDVQCWWHGHSTVNNNTGLDSQQWCKHKPCIHACKQHRSASP